MLFNSLAFLIYFPIVVLLYWVLPHKYRNPFLLAASYYFYMNWEPIYALLIFFSTIVTWLSGILMSRRPLKKRLWLTVCIVLNIAVLFVYKYAGFFSTAVHDLLSAVGIAMEVPKFTLLLPVGISFYTFQAIGYSIDVYRGTIPTERNLLTYALFVSFFPQLVAGPIERAKNLLPQFHQTHKFNSDKLISGIQMMMWGYFMKLCIADNVASYVDAVYNNLPMHNGTSILLASFFFTFQIFCDFGGYSLIAIGAARSMDFTLMQNFRQPYLATSIKDFWRRWHISLTTWFTDYVYIPLGGNRCSKLKHKRNILITFLVSGIWHGANYTFIVWGAYHGMLQVAQVAVGDVTKRIETRRRKITAAILKIASVVFTFTLVAIGWVFFRANSLSDAVQALYKMGTDQGPLFNGAGKPAIILPLILIGILMAFEITNERRAKRQASVQPSMTKSIIVTAALVIIILLCGSLEGGQFIYFQF